MENGGANILASQMNQWGLTITPNLADTERRLSKSEFLVSDRVSVFLY